MKQLFITARKRSFGQGNVFTPVCLFTGGSASEGPCLQGGLHPGGLGRPPPQTRKAGGMHPTVMFSCFYYLLKVVLKYRGNYISQPKQFIDLSVKVSRFLKCCVNV